MSEKLTINNLPLSINKVPALRFSEFSGEWENKNLGDVVSFASGGTPSKKIPSYWGGDIPWISAVSMHTDIINKSEKFVTEIGVKNGTRLAYKNTILLLVRGSMLFNRIPAGICIRTVAFNQDVKALAVKEKNSPHFLLFFIRARENHLLSLVTGTGIGAGKLDTDELKSLSFLHPTLPEQQKIATFLSAVDKKLGHLRRKHALLETYKRGVMQKIFSQELRFKQDGDADFPDWEEKRLGDYINNYRLGGNYSNSGKITDCPLIKMGNLGRGEINLRKIEYITKNEDVDDIDRLRESNLLFNTRNTLDLVGKVSIWKNELPIAYYNSNLMKMDFESNYFMNYRLNSFAGIKSLRRIATGTTSVAAIYTKDLLKIKLCIPILEEQQKIANFLSTLDKKLEAVQTQIDQTETFKKGLLQKMFV